MDIIPEFLICCREFSTGILKEHNVAAQGGLQCIMDF